MNYVWGTTCGASRSSNGVRHASYSLEEEEEELKLVKENEPVTGVSPTVTAAIAVGCSMLVFLVMSLVMMCVIKTHQKNMMLNVLFRSANAEMYDL